MLIDYAQSITLLKYRRKNITDAMQWNSDMRDIIIFFPFFIKFQFFKRFFLLFPSHTTTFFSSFLPYFFLFPLLSLFHLFLLFFSLPPPNFFAPFMLFPTPRKGGMENIYPCPTNKCSLSSIFFFEYCIVVVGELFMLFIQLN